MQVNLATLTLWIQRTFLVTYMFHKMEVLSVNKSPKIIKEGSEFIHLKCSIQCLAFSNALLMK